jgi:hypothetical protein
MEPDGSDTHEHFDFGELTTIDNVAVNPLSIMVDFNELYRDLGEKPAIALVVRLRDALRE